MTHQASCLFYDGNSSRPHPVELFLDPQRHALFFETEPQTFTKWELQAVSMQKTGTSLTLQHGQDPIQTIVVRDAAFIAALLAHKRPDRKSWYDSLLSGGFGVHVALALVILGAIVLSYVYLIPWVGEKSVVMIPESYDAKMGRMFFEQSILFDEIDPKKTKTLNQFARQLHFNNPKPLQFTVVKSETVNAFALPDGNIVVYTGILDKMKDHTELVALIGHEASHVHNRHSMKMICRNLSGYLFVSAILGDANGVMATIGDNVNSLQSLSFSREFEREADAGGFAIMKRNQIDPRGMSELFARLDDIGNFMPEFLSTHPITGERIKFIDRLIRTEPYAIRENPNLQTLFKTLKQ